MRLKRRRIEAEESATGIDLAPMLDFVLNLLIFFIITAVFVKETGFRVERHGGGATGAAAPGEKTAGSISVVINRDGEVIVDSRVVDPRAVRANVERLHAQKPEWGAMVTTAPDIEMGLLVLVIDQIRLAGVHNVSVGTASR